MKTFLRALLVGACLPALLFAAGGLTLGGGLNASFMDPRQAGPDYSNRLGFNVGIGYEVPANVPHLWLAPELNLETRGDVAEQYTLLPPFGRAEARVKLLYLQVPLFLMVKVPVGGANLNVFAGPALGIRLAAEGVYALNGDETTIDLKDETQPLDLGLEMGVGVEAPLGPGSVFVRPSYYHGLANVNADEDEEGEIRLRNLKLKAGYRFPL
jgi:hypothetical protein